MEFHFKISNWTFLQNAETEWRNLFMLIGLDSNHSVMSIRNVAWVGKQVRIHSADTISSNFLLKKNVMDLNQQFANDDKNAVVKVRIFCCRISCQKSVESIMKNQWCLSKVVKLKTDIAGWQYLSGFFFHFWWWNVYLSTNLT